MKTRLLALVALVVFSLATSLSPAHAGGKGWVPANTPIYRCPWRGCAVDRVTQYNAWLPFECWKDSPAQYGNVERFFLVSTVGWIQAWRVSSQPSLPKC